MTYIIYELQNLNSVRQGTIYTGSLAGAKAKATRDQVWQGTILKITDKQGRAVHAGVTTLEWIEEAR